jgi:hypothetical protein
MAKLRVRYLSTRPRRTGTAYYWLPTPALQKAGFLPRRLSDDKAEAIAQAERFNAELDAWRDHGTRPSGITLGSLAAVDLEFQRDDDFKRLAPRSQADYLRCIKPALDWAGDQPIGDLTRRFIKAWYRQQRDMRGEANSRNAMAALRRLLSYAVSEDHIPDNPAMKLRVTAPASRDRVWTLDERDRFVAAAKAHGRPSMAAAVVLGWCLGQRPADLRTLAWTAWDGRTVALRQAKTGALVRVPALPDLRTLLDDLPRTSTQIVVSETTKRPYQESAFQHLFAEIRTKAGLPADLQFRDLRRTLATALGAAGCTDDQIRAITGHKTRNVVAVYVRPDNAFAEGAIDRLRTKVERG